MTKRVECMCCHIQMENGFVTDCRHDGYVQEQWTPGDPTPSFWMGLKLEKDKLLPVFTLRCPACMYLEVYAFRADKPELYSGPIS